jgi:hypothetical protein
MKIFDFFRKYMGKMVGAGAEIFDKLEPEPHKNGPAPQHCLNLQYWQFWKLWTARLKQF